MPQDEEMERREGGDALESVSVERVKEPVPPLYTRLRFAMYLLVSFILCLIVKDGLWGAFEWSSAIKGGCTGTIAVSPSPTSLSQSTSITDSVKGMVKGAVSEKVVSKMCTGHEMVFRFSFTCAIFYLIHAMVQIRECCCVDEAQKNDFQAGYFGIKTLIFVVLLIVTMFIPNDFFHFYAQLCIGGSAIFLVLQVILLIDFIYGWNDSWARKSEDEPRWATYLVMLTILFYLAGTAVIIVMFVEFLNDDSCFRNWVFISTCLVMGILYTMLSVRMPHGSIFVSSIVYLYTSIICFSAIRNGDSSTCNNLPVDTSGGITWTLVATSAFVGISIAWASVSAGSQRQAMSLTGDADWESEDVKQSKNYLFFHCVMVLGSMYMSMILTNWKINPDEELNGPAIAHGEAMMWVQIASEWLATIAFIWTLLAPVYCCKDRDFDFV
eukprot:TRINITY_DN42441_c0_g1_i1.p1 TRINITY_DN42441_c0_g1~~TRINITY_DN42441_c0_g1_i1.p1  ORF type:complete len:439 (+),score=146.42 TRINITY_DN42441_c0_g1_i1:47-1363(+)